MSQPLFFEPDVQFEKVAAEVMLPEDANTWSNELMQELYKQVPYVADFAPHVTMDRVDAERGFGFGHIEVQNKTEIQHGAPPDAMASAGIKSARIPVIIKDRKLQPLDLLITDDSKVLPLTESRLRSVIFRPQAFDITGRGPGDMSMIGQLYPPYRQNYGFGGGGATMNVGMGKEGSALEEYLEKEAAGLFSALRSPSQAFAEHAAALGHSAGHAAGKGGVEGATGAAKELLSKHKGKILGGAAAAYGGNKAIDYGIQRHLDKEQVKDLSRAGAGQGGFQEQLKQSSAKVAFGPEAAKTVVTALKSGVQPQRAAKLQGMLQRSAVRKMTTGQVPFGQKVQTLANYAGSKAASILESILPTIRESDYNDFAQKVANDRGLYAQYVANSVATGDALKLLLAYEPGSVRKLASAVLSNLKPTVVQLRKEAEGYTLKTAAHNCWTPEELHLDRGAAVRLLGDKIVLAADMTGSSTMALGEGVQEPESPEADKPELISQFGIYKVQDEQGRDLIGYVFPNLIDIDGTALPIALFTNGSQMSVQGDIAGVNVGGGASLFEGPPRGKGAFYHLLPNGRAEATIPMTIKATMDSPEEGGVTFHAETFEGQEIQVLVQPNIERVTPSPDGSQLLIPDSFSWLPLDAAEETALVGDPEAVDQEAEAKLSYASVQVRCGGSDSFSVDGYPVEKLGSDSRHFLSLDDTMFLLGGLGVDLDYAQKKIGQAAAWNTPVQVHVGREIKTAAMRLDEAGESAASILAGMPSLRVDLSKEAAVIPDPSAVDTVLSLGFINPENLGTFIGALPEIDGTQSKLCELLLAARLGLRNIPAPALEKAIRSMEEVIEGLKILAFEKS